jgi:hypothetical protein
MKMIYGIDDLFIPDDTAVIEVRKGKKDES